MQSSLPLPADVTLYTAFLYGSHPLGTRLRATLSALLCIIGGIGGGGSFKISIHKHGWLSDGMHSDITPFCKTQAPHFQTYMAICKQEAHISSVVGRIFVEA